MGLMQLMVQLGLNATGYETGLKRAHSQAQSFGNQLSHELGGKIASAFSVVAIVGGIEEGIRRTIEWADKMGNLAVRTGIPVEELQVLEIMASRADVSIDSLVKGYEKLGITMAKARAGGQESDAYKTLTRLGVSAKQIASGDAQAISGAFANVSEHVRASANSAQLLKDLTEGVGKNELIPAMKEGLGDPDQRAWAETLAIGANKMAAMKEVADEFKDVWNTIAATGKWFVGLLSQGFIGALNSFKDFSAGVGGFFDALVHGKNPLTGFGDYSDASREKHIARTKEMQDQLRGQGGMITEQEEDATKKTALEHLAAKRKRDAEEILRIHERIQAVAERTAQRSMTDAERLRHIDAQLLEHKEKAAQLSADAWKELKNDSFEKDRVAGAGVALERENLKIAELEDQRAQEQAKLDKKDDKANHRASNNLRSAHASSLVDIGNFLGIAGDPTRGVHEKLDVIHQDLVQIIKKDGAAGGLIFP
jgi:hypothetical protein